jgi:hypothetical protein
MRRAATRSPTMAPKKKRAPVNAELTEVRERIRAAEKKFAPIVREQVGLDAESFATVGTLVERGLGRKPEVLRQALETGLRVLLAGSAGDPPQPSFATDEGQAFRIPFPSQVVAAPEKFEPIPTGMGMGVLGGGLGLRVVRKPSEERQEEGDDAADSEEVVS